MKKLTLLSAVLCILILIGSCSKKKPHIGNYYGTFTYDIPTGITNFAEIEITESSADKIIINNSELQKNGKKISGRIVYLPFSQFGINIKGKWSHKLFSKEYSIKGSFTEDYYQGGGQYQNSGTFIIKSN